MKTILITGSAGLLGSHLIGRFTSRGYRVIGVDSLIGGYSSNMPKNSESFVHLNIDVLDRKKLEEEVRKVTDSLELTVHCAALAHEGLSVFSPKTIVENIYAGTASVASLAVSLKCPTFINTTSMARYGNGTPPFRESDTPTPVDPYGLAKLHAEEHLNLMSDIYDFKVFHMVPHNVCGPHQCYSDPFRNVMSIFANRIKKDKPVYIYGDGEQMRSFSHVDDCVDAFITLYNNKEQIKNKEIFNIGPDDGTEITITQLAHKVSAQFNQPADIINVPDRPREVKKAWVSTEKARKVLGYNTKNSPDDTIRDTVSWMRRQPDRDFNYHLDLEIITEQTPKTWTDKLFNK